MLSPSPVILSEAKNLRSSLRVNSAKNLRSWLRVNSAKNLRSSPLVTGPKKELRRFFVRQKAADSE